MKSALFWIAGALALAVSLSARPALAADSDDNAADAAAMKKNAEAFTAAFDKGDAKAVAAFWTPDGDYVDETGRHMKGREEIEKAFTEFFSENKGLKVQIHTESLRFVTPDVAVEDGVTSVTEPDGGPPSRARYTVVHVKKDGKWHVEQRPRLALRPAQQLRTLERVGMGYRRLDERVGQRRNRPGFVRVGGEPEFHPRNLRRDASRTSRSPAGRKPSAGTRSRSKSAPGPSTRTAASAKRPGRATATAGSSRRSWSCRTARRSRPRTSSRASARTPSPGSRRIEPWTASRCRT